MQLADLGSWVIFAQDDFGGGGGAEDAVAAGVMIVVMIIAMVISLAIWGFILYTYYSALNSIPAQFRTMEPWQVFLLLIPCFNIIWLFFVVQKIPESFRNYFQAVGDHSRGDCGAGIGLWYAILTVVSAIPLVNYISLIPTLILLIMFIVKMWQLKGVVQSGAAAFQGAGGGQFGGGYYGGDPKNPYASPGNQPPKF
jgi:hypothetical protein